MKARSKKAILVAVLLAAWASVWAARDQLYFYGYLEGRYQAWQEIRKDTPTLYVYGDLGPQMVDGAETEYGIPYKAIAGCIVSRRQMGLSEGHNTLILDHLAAD